MRGKHGNAAATRRDRAELEQRAEKAEHRAEKADKELAELREKSEQQITGLRGELAQTRRNLDTAAAPAVAEAERQIRTLMGERDQALEQRQSIQDKWNAFGGNAIALLRDMGFTNTEAIEVFAASCLGDGTTRTLTSGVESAYKRVDHEGVMAIQRARGQRNALDPLGPVAPPRRRQLGEGDGGDDRMPDATGSRPDAP